jgi:hypothetical protein
MLRNKLWEGRVETSSQYIVCGGVKGDGVQLGIACLGGERQPVGDEVVATLEVLGA